MRLVYTLLFYFKELFQCFDTFECHHKHVCENMLAKEWMLTDTSIMFADNKPAVSDKMYGSTGEKL